MSMTGTATVMTALIVLVAAACTTTGTDPSTTTSTVATSTTATDSTPSTTTTAGISTTTSIMTTTTSAPVGDFDIGRKAILALAASEGDEVPTADLGFADTVSLGVHNRLTVERSAEELADYTGWIINALEYAGFSGPFVPLEALRDGGPLVIDQGPHPHCAGPPLDAPEGFESATRVHAQPKDIDSCISWFSVDLWIVDGQIEAVTFELFGP